MESKSSEKERIRRELSTSKSVKDNTLKRLKKDRLVILFLFSKFLLSSLFLYSFRRKKERKKGREVEDFVMYFYSKFFFLTNVTKIVPTRKRQKKKENGTKILSQIFILFLLSLTFQSDQDRKETEFFDQNSRFFY